MPGEHNASQFPGLGMVEAECENGHTANVRNGSFPSMGHCSECEQQVVWDVEDLDD